MGRYRIKVAVVAAAAALVAASAGSASAAPAKPDQAADRTAEGVASAGTPVPLPDLGFAHRRGDGGINLFRMPLSELEEGFGTPQLVRSLTARAGFLYDRTKVLAGDIADFTAGDDGTADHVLLVSRSDGGMGVWVVPGSSTTTPQQQFILRASAGWSWANSRPQLGDVTGDGWDDLVVERTPGAGSTQLAVWVFPSTGARLGAPVLWQTENLPNAAGLNGGRGSLGDYDGDLDEDRIAVIPHTEPKLPGLNIRPWISTGTAFTGPAPISSEGLMGFQYRYSRDVAGDVDGDGYSDLVTVHRTGSDAFYAFVHPTVDLGSDSGFGLPELWQTSGGTFSFAYSRQYMADTNADGFDDLISVHRTARGVAVFRHVSDGSSFAPPELVAHLLTANGWKWPLVRESVADTWGVTA